jgi:23S rRNA (cytosine1962-C5)-methyltransferase
MPETLRITRRAADRLLAGHLWIYRTDIESPTADLNPGSLITLTDPRNAPLGTALYSTASQIAARLVSRTPNLTREQYLADVRTRITSAIQRRRETRETSATFELFQRVIPLVRTGFGVFESVSNAGRLIFSEADDLPGIIVDRYNDLIIVQLLTQGTAQDDVRHAIIETLRNYASTVSFALTIWERPDPRIRELEQLAPPTPGPLFTNLDGEPPTTTTFTLNGLHFTYNAAAGQKTGAFLDQRTNYAAAAARVRASGHTDRALDICTYQGGFALHLAQVCQAVTGVDASRAALEVADHNLTLNPGLQATTDWIEADAFDLLRAYDTQQEKFDAIVLDPPAFAKSKRAAEGAARGYKELNLRALRMLQPGGTLITNSCSHHVSLEDFTAIVASAAADAGRRVQLLETRAAAPDHPEVLTLPETRYLKCLICRID